MAEHASERAGTPEAGEEARAAKRQPEETGAAPDGTGCNAAAPDGVAAPEAPQDDAAQGQASCDGVSAETAAPEAPQDAESQERAGGGDTSAPADEPGKLAAAEEPADAPASAADEPLARRRFIALAGGGALLVALAAYLGVRSYSQRSSYTYTEDDETEVESAGEHVAGCATDTEQPTYDVTLKIYADSMLQWHHTTYAGYDDMLDYLFSAYHDNTCSYVTCETTYIDTAELTAMIEDGFEDGDAVIACTSVIDDHVNADTLDGGTENWMVRDLSFHVRETCTFVRATGSSVTLPEADTIDGEDSSSGEYNRLQKLPEFDGTVALVDEQQAAEGALFNAVLANQGFYTGSDGTGGTFTADIADKLVVYDSVEEAMAAVADGTCDIGIALDAQIGARFSGVESFYDPPKPFATGYSGVATSISGEAAVARDVFEFLANMFTG